MFGALALPCWLHTRRALGEKHSRSIHHWILKRLEASCGEDA